MTTRKFRLERLPAAGVAGTGEPFRDKRGLIRTFGDVRRAVEALIDAGHDPDEWRVWWRNTDRIWWVACPGNARDAVYVMTGEVLR
jgi:hypothetical protein